jgi:hypothetical protein
VSQPKSRPAAGGGRWVQVDPERLELWLGGFAQRHGAVRCLPAAEQVLITAADGSTAQCQVPFPPMLVDPADGAGGLVAHAVADRRVGVLLFRLGGHAVGIFEGVQLVASKVGSRPVHGRSSAGGWSQQRFARRRLGQVAVATGAAAETAVAVLLPWLGRLDAMVVGGDRGAVAAVLQDPRLSELMPLVTQPFLDVPDPRLKVLAQSCRQFRAVRIRLLEAGVDAALSGGTQGG